MHLPDGAKPPPKRSRSFATTSGDADREHFLAICLDGLDRLRSVFGTAVDVTAAELAIESFLPADEDTARALREMSAAADTAG